MLIPNFSSYLPLTINPLKSLPPVILPDLTDLEHPL